MQTHILLTDNFYRQSLVQMYIKPNGSECIYLDLFLFTEMYVFQNSYNYILKTCTFKNNILIW